ncbi:CocE/NonD family hydrolase [Streptomyces sp. NPDC102462]|uniref:CocE/NonD family hydrolase n=1 Tax=Streptomyces sp. NPDC102462 TaxID=3366178 RepID=UPI003830FB28
MWRPLTDEPTLLEYAPDRLTDRTAPRGAQRHPWYAGHGYVSVRVDAHGYGGNVGVFGISRSGSASLRIAALAPEPLKAVVAVRCPDGRYENERQGPGGSAVAARLHARSAAALSAAALPPDPRYTGDSWQAVRQAHLKALTSAPHTTGQPLALGTVKAAVPAVGGWYDPCHDTVLRLVERLPHDRVRGSIGPWSHPYPDRDLSPGPAIGFLQQTLRWWDH